jgi:glycosyltransferase involved in cell wall biosynthesis
MKKISIAVIAKNEADRINRLLKSAEFADEVLVVDSGSTDGTQEVCKKLGAKVVFHEWAGYAAQKQFAMDCTTSEWILNLDADEEISHSLKEEIQNAIKNATPDVCAFSMSRLSRYLGRWIKHGGWYPDRKVRLVRRGKGMWEGDGLHEQLIVNGKIERLSEPILHYVYRNISDHVATINRFSDIYSVDRGPKGGWFVLAGIVHALGKFAECYLWKLGFLDGIPGLVIAMNSAWYVFLKHAKAWESGLHV